MTIPDSVTSIGRGAFERCTGLTSVTIGSGVQSIGEYAFYGCIGLKGVYITNIAAWCKIEFGNSYANPLYYAGNLYVNNVLVQDIVLPDGSESIGNYVFVGYSRLTSVTIPDSVKSIGEGAFYGCSNLLWVTIEEGVQSIGEYAFYGCSSLTRMTIPYGLGLIGEYAFSGCSNLRLVTFESTSLWSVKIGPGRFIRISSTDLSNISLAAKYLVTTYQNYTWSWA